MLSCVTYILYTICRQLLMQFTEAFNKHSRKIVLHKVLILCMPVFIDTGLLNIDII